MSTDPAGTGSPETKLVIIRGNSGSGKSTISRRLQRSYGRGCALVEQDYLRRIILRERDQPGGIAADFIDHTARFALDHGYHVLLEGILHRARYRPMLDGLRAAHQGETYVFYLDVSFEETLRRHATRPQASEFTPAQMQDWYIRRDLLDTPDELVIAESSTQEETVAFIADITGLCPVTPKSTAVPPGG